MTEAPTCEDCADAKRKRYHGGYRARCDGCTARALSRSQAAFKAIRENDPADLRFAMSKALPKMDPDEARKLVWSWWELDHKEVSA